mmetsp:Transcript_25548/g.75525  ORF Transcript_25548/g.75525 Transcript_25548/m.75525 type:complete len:215 (+) Transcript_25548:2461-3105(+)
MLQAGTEHPSARVRFQALHRSLLHRVLHRALYCAHKSSLWPQPRSYYHRALLDAGRSAIRSCWELVAPPWELVAPPRNHMQRPSSPTRRPLSHRPLLPTQRPSSQRQSSLTQLSLSHRPSSQQRRRFPALCALQQQPQPPHLLLVAARHVYALTQPTPGCLWSPHARLSLASARLSLVATRQAVSTPPRRGLARLFPTSKPAHVPATPCTLSVT